MKSRHKMEFIPTCRQPDPTFKVKSLFSDNVFSIFDNKTGLRIGKAYMTEEKEVVVTNHKDQISMFK